MYVIAGKGNVHKIRLATNERLTIILGNDDTSRSETTPRFSL